MRRDLTASIIAFVLFTLALGVVYPLVVTGIAQVTMHGKASGSVVRAGGHVVGSNLIAQGFTTGSGANVEPDPRYFQERPSQTSYAGNASSFLNQGPDQAALATTLKGYVASVLALERPYHPGLTAAQLPVDAVTNSASGIDPGISVAYADLQVARVASERHASASDIRRLVTAHTHGRALGLFGEPWVDVLALNLDLDRKHPVR